MYYRKQFQIKFDNFQGSRVVVKIHDRLTESEEFLEPQITN